MFDGQRFEQSLGIAGFEVEVAGNEVRKTSGFLGLGQKLLHRLLGHAGAAAEFGGPFAGFTIQSGKGRVVGVEGEHLFRLVDGRHQIFILFVITDRDGAVVAVEQQAHARRPPLHRPDGGHATHAVEDVGGHILAVFPLRDHEDLLVFGAQRGLDCAQRAGTAGRDG